MVARFKTISPADGRICVERPYATDAEIGAALERAAGAHAPWKRTPVAERARLCRKAVQSFVAEKPAIAAEISRQMGRPIAYSPGEVMGFQEHALYMIEAAPRALADVDVGPKAGFTRFIRAEPLGLVLVIAPWNYPFLTAVNAVMPAVMAGDTVILKHSVQTPLAAERFADAFRAAGLPEGVFQFLHLTHADTAHLIRAPEVAFVAFTGSVPGGEMVERAAAGRFIGLGLELGGKDPAYVRADCDLAHAIETVVDGAFFNSGQSCCGIERVYVHADVYDPFVAGAAELVAKYRLGDPLDPTTTLGPMVRTEAADAVRAQVKEALAAGAKGLVDPALFPAARDGTPYLAPEVLVGVDHAMRVMTEETFGPVVGVMKVADDADAIRLMNDSVYGLTAAVFTRDAAAAVRIGDAIDTGTWFMNRCDYLDPALAWTGVKNSGRGCTLSALGYAHLTRPKSFHLRVAVRPPASPA